MKKKSVLTAFLLIIMTASIIGCGQEEASSTEPKDEMPQKGITLNTESPEETQGEEPVSDEELFEAFLKNREEVHFTNYQPEKYFEICEYLYDKEDSATLNELIATYDKYYLEELTYTPVYYDIGYTYIDMGDVGRKQLVVECGFPQGTGAQFVIGVEDGKLELIYVIDSFERQYGTVANKYGLITRTGSSSYAEYSIVNEYLDENGEVHNIYTESVNYLFGQETGYADPLLEWAADFRKMEGFKDDVILKTYSFDEFEADFTPEEEEKYYNNMLYTVEYVTDEEPWHEDAMYEEGSIFNRIFEKANRPLSTPEEIEKAILKKKEELGMPTKAMEEDPVILTDLTDKEIGAILGADVDDGKSELEHALIAYKKFLENPVNMCEMLTEQMISPYNDPTPGLVYGFALRDFTDDEIPELVIDFGLPGFPMMQKIYIYTYSEINGKVSQMFKMQDGARGDYGIDYIKQNMNESYILWYNEDLEEKISKCPEFADSLLNVKYKGTHMVGTSGRYLVVFDEGVEENTDKTLMWYDFVEDFAQSYTEMLLDVDGNFDYSTDESCVDNPEDVLSNYKPILFYDITDENIANIVNEDYWKKNVGNNGFSDYTEEDAYRYLSQKAKWYFDLGIMDDDDTYDTISCYDYDEYTDTSTTIYFNLDKLIQSRFRTEW